MSERSRPPGDTHNTASGGQQGLLIQARDIMNLYVQPHVSVGVRGLIAGFGLYLLAVRPELPLPQGYDPGPERLGWHLLALALASSVAARALTARRRRHDRAWTAPAYVEGVVDGLADALCEQYKQDERLLHIIEPHIIEVPWTPQPERPGTTVSAYFDSLPGRRLVVIGGAGAGKTVLALRLATELLTGRDDSPERPIPLVVPLAAWNPDEGLAGWLAQRLADDFPRVCAPVPGARPHDVALHLLRATDRVLPILDGFDELPPARHKEALRQLVETLRGRPFVLTTRADEYLEHAPDQSVFARTEITLQTLTDETVSGYLNPSGSNDSPWNLVLAQLRITNDNSAETKRLREALRVPLLAGLARVTYGWDGNDPAKLLSPEYTKQGALEEHLYDVFLNTAYSASPDVRTEQGGWRSEDARRWMEFLAFRLKAANEPDLAWWRLQKEMPWPVRLLYLAPAYLLSVLLLTRADIATGQWSGPMPVWLAYALACTPTLYGFAADPDNERSYLTPWLLGRPDGALVRKALRGWKGRLVALGLALTTAGTITSALRHLWPAAGLCAVAVAALLQPVLPFAWRFADQTPERTPRETIRADRQVVLTLGWLAPLRLSPDVLSSVSSRYPLLLAPILFTWWQFNGRTLHTDTPLDWAIVVASWWLYAVGLSAWGQYGTARVWYAATGRLPWRLTAFLEDAHARGVLRQSGAVYHFRHIELRERLAETYKDKPLRPAPRRAPLGYFASILSAVLLTRVFFGAMNIHPPPDPAPHVPAACSLLDDHEVQRLTSTDTKLALTKSSARSLPGRWPPFPGRNICTVASDPSPTAPALRIGVAATGWTSTDTFNGALYAGEQFRALGQKPSPGATEHRLPDLGDEAAVLIKKDAHGLWPKGPAPWQTMVRVRVGNALFVTTYAEQSATRAHTTKAAETLMRDLLRRSDLARRTP
ncbi:NACHT domain-containing protein [Streptomyces sp. NPDC050423]|uniref:NACHT domain-containing protein n=1 Tax=Streptomyces sp. NPDC050423 TaxID=3155402 RepID=UPI003439656A